MMANMAREDILEGLVCEVCGEWFDDMHAGTGGEPPGHPRRCGRCGRREPSRAKAATKRRNLPCPHCARRFGNLIDVRQHVAAKHGGQGIAEIKAAAAQQEAP